MNLLFYATLIIIGTILVLLSPHHHFAAASGAFGQLLLTTLKDDSTKASLGLKIAAHDTSPGAIRSLAFYWSHDAFVQLSRPVIVAFPLSELNFNGNVTLQLQGERLTFKIDTGLLKAFNLHCLNVNEDNDGGGDFVYETKVEPTTRAIVWRFVTWNEDDFTRLPVVSLTVFENGSIAESLPLLPNKCHRQEEATKQQSAVSLGGVGDSTADADVEVNVDENPPPVVVQGNFTIVASSHLTTFAHADDYKQTAQYYSTQSVLKSARQCTAPCVPVLLTLPPPTTGWEYGCRLNAGDNLTEWWRCDHLGIQHNLAKAVGLLGGITARMRIASSLKSDPTSCLDIRHDGAPGIWQRYDETAKTYLFFDSTDFEWSEADNATRHAYRCVSQQDGTVLKDIYLDDGHVFVEDCHISDDEVFVHDLDDVSRIELQCDLLSRLAGCQRGKCAEKAAFTIEPASVVPPNWEKLSRRFVITEATLTSKGRLFRLSIDFSRIRNNYDGLVGDYNIFLHFRQNNVSYLASRFRIDDSLPPTTETITTTTTVATSRVTTAIQDEIMMTTTLPLANSGDDQQLWLKEEQSSSMTTTTTTTMTTTPKTPTISAFFTARAGRKPKPPRVEPIATTTTTTLTTPFSLEDSSEEEEDAEEEETEDATSTTMVATTIARSTLMKNSAFLDLSHKNEEHQRIVQSTVTDSFQMSEKMKEAKPTTPNVVHRQSTVTMVENSTLTSSPTFDFTIYGNTQLIDRFVESLSDKTTTAAMPVETTTTTPPTTMMTPTTVIQPRLFPSTFYHSISLPSNDKNNNNINLPYYKTTMVPFTIRNNKPSSISDGNNMKNAGKASHISFKAATSKRFQNFTSTTFAATTSTMPSRRFSITTQRKHFPQPTSIYSPGQLSPNNDEDYDYKKLQKERGGHHNRQLLLLQTPVGVSPTAKISEVTFVNDNNKPDELIGSAAIAMQNKPTSTTNNNNNNRPTRRRPLPSSSSSSSPPSSLMIMNSSIITTTITTIIASCFILLHKRCFL